MLRLINTTQDEGGALATDFIDITAECNTSAAVGSDYYEGSVSAVNVSMRVKRGGYLSVRYNPGCVQNNDSCFFQPAIIDKPSNNTLYFFTVQLVRSDPRVSLFFSAKITTGNISHDIYSLCLVSVSPYYLGFDFLFYITHCGSAVWEMMLNVATCSMVQLN